MVRVKPESRRDDPRYYQVTNNNPIDVHVGRRVRVCRTLLGMSQEQLGDALNISMQQVQKYECGAIRISASRLWDIAQVLDVSIGFLFDDMPDDAAVRSPRRMKTGEERGDYDESPADPMARRETLELVRAYYRIRSPDQRKWINELVKFFATELPEEPAQSVSGPASGKLSR